ncbi:3-hydroxyisobutyryl-CoA hydrolase [Limnohabitans sp. MORI2]|uniref:enoyl-CoA hydratase/isomerase family protein n=1 Tax=Limnohabitans sp. MORI2 TaxID=1751150 RepID=UPI002377B98E|nr:enoyl-CoA hydratase/isomerase family protein [Limnohabitans sp. MORI2]BDU58180.1 3-hydroxyisobutyryl-CoA hydrolase [Limnohabitans sp. MORI2]
MSTYTTDVHAERVGHLGLITLNRPKALNALSLAMVRELNHVLQQWQDDALIKAVVVRGSNKEGPFGAFCAGGDIRYFHQAALSGDVTLEDFFTEEYSLNHLIQNYSKPYIAFMDGIVMGGGMGISQGAALRVVTERTKMAMPETHIGLFPDVGGGYFLGRCAGPACPAYMGEYLALTGYVLRGGESLHVGLADVCVDSMALPALWDALQQHEWATGDAVVKWLREQAEASTAQALTQTPAWQAARIDQVFGLATVADMEQALQGDDEWSMQTLKALHHQSPLMLCVTLEQVRRGKNMTLADDLRMERDLVRHCFQTDHLSRRGVSSETVEGIRALAVDKDHTPKWQPSRITDVTSEMVLPFFESPWPASAHPLRHLR